eukprot:364629-Chlamydomonas_euryale.AAC.4
MREPRGSCQRAHHGGAPRHLVSGRVCRPGGDIWLGRAGGGSGRGGEAATGVIGRSVDRLGCGGCRAAPIAPVAAPRPVTAAAPVAAPYPAAAVPSRSERRRRPARRGDAVCQMVGVAPLVLKTAGPTAAAAATRRPPHHSRRPTQRLPPQRRPPRRLPPRRPPHRGCLPLRRLPPRRRLPRRLSQPHAQQREYLRRRPGRPPPSAPPRWAAAGGRVGPHHVTPLRRPTPLPPPLPVAAAAAAAAARFAARLAAAAAARIAALLAAAAAAAAEAELLVQRAAQRCDTPVRTPVLQKCGSRSADEGEAASEGVKCAHAGREGHKRQHRQPWMGVGERGMGYSPA